MIYLIASLAVILDQLTKYLAVSHLPEHQFVPVCPFFNFFLTYNKGVSFSFLWSDTAYGPYVLSLLSLIICLGLVYWITRESDQFMKACLALVLGGALGNVIDRVRIGSVIDFLDFYYHSYHWPAFNLADTAICCGAGLLFFKLFLQKKEKK